VNSPPSAAQRRWGANEGGKIVKHRARRRRRVRSTRLVITPHRQVVVSPGGGRKSHSIAPAWPQQFALHQQSVLQSSWNPRRTARRRGPGRDVSARNRIYSRLGEQRLPCSHPGSDRAVGGISTMRERCQTGSGGPLAWLEWCEIQGRGVLAELIAAGKSSAAVQFCCIPQLPHQDLYLRRYRGWCI
jgi:hypothetical protein